MKKKKNIENILLKSANFKLDIGQKVIFSAEKEEKIFFIEKIDNYNEMYHYIMTNEGSEAGYFFNEFLKSN